MRKVLLVLGLVGAAAIITVAVGSVRWGQSSDQLVEGLFRISTGPSTGSVSLADLEGLPGPVVRYFHRVLRDGQPLVEAVRFSQRGWIRTNEKADSWSSYSAKQVVTARAPGFVWDARVRVAPFLHVRVRDACVGGEGSGRVSFLSVVSLAAERGGSELNSASLYRYFAEAVWYPTALLPSAGVVWSPIDQRTAMATLANAGTTVSIEFRFNDDGEVIGVYAPGRYRKVDDGYEHTPWEGRLGRYEQRSGMWIPIEAQVGWHLSGKWQPVWKGTITEIEYQFAN